MFNEFSLSDTSKAKTTADCWARFWQDDRALFIPMSRCWGIRAIFGHHHHHLSSVTLNMEFSRQDHWSVLPFPFPGDLPDPGIQPGSPALQADSLPLSHQGSPKGRAQRFQVRAGPEELGLSQEKRAIQAPSNLLPLLLSIYIFSWGKHGCVCVLSCSVVSDSLQPYGLQPARLLRPWDFLGKNIAVGCHNLLQGIFPTREDPNPGLPQYTQTLYHLSQTAISSVQLVSCVQLFTTPWIAAHQASLSITNSRLQNNYAKVKSHVQQIREELPSLWVQIPFRDSSLKRSSDHFVLAHEIRTVSHFK